MLLENAALGMGLKMILVQSDEAVVGESEAAAAGFSTVSELTRARVRAAISRLNADTPPRDGEDRGFVATRLSQGK